MLTDEQKGRLAEGIAALVAEIFSGPGEAADEVAEDAAEDVLDTLAAPDEEKEELMGDEEKEELAAALAAARSDAAALRAKLRAVELGARIDKAGLVLSTKERAELIDAGPKAVEMAIKFSAGSATTRLAAGGLPPADEPVSRQEQFNRKFLAVVESKGGEA